MGASCTHSLPGCRIGRFPPVVRTAVPVDGRFEHIVLSCNATSDHAIIWIERESKRALDVRMLPFNLFNIRTFLCPCNATSLLFCHYRK